MPSNTKAAALLVAALIALNASCAAAKDYIYRISVAGLSASAATQSAGLPANAGACLSGTATTCASYAGQLSRSVSGLQGVRASICKASGRWYYEVTPTAFSGSPAIRAAIVGWSSSTSPASTGNGTTDSGTYGFSEYYGQGNYASRVSETSIGGAPYASGETVGIAIDLDAHTMSVYRQGALNATVYSGIPAGSYCPAMVATGALYNNSATSSFNFGQAAFAYPVPAGYNAGVY
jgi:hypothetical protein